jgi:hypothetical protein
VVALFKKCARRFSGKNVPNANARVGERWQALGHFRWRSELTMYNQARLQKRPACRRARDVGSMPRPLSRAKCETTGSRAE